jgi:serine/threonine protein kinase
LAPRRRRATHGTARTLSTDEPIGKLPDRSLLYAEQMPPLLTEGQIVRNHRIGRRIGHGGMGEVYEAAHVSLQRRVAIKVLHPDWCKNPDLVKRFFNEALATNLIRHPAMVEIHDHGKFPDGMPFLIMEFLEGQSLRRYRGTLSPIQVVRLAWQVASGLRAAHAKKIVHRDLKPDNIMVLRDDTVPGGQRVKILDFGLAKLAAEHQQEGAEAVKTRDGVALGTPEYMAPEQWLGASKVDGKADVYSLGVVLYETIAGAPPFPSSEGSRLRSLHLYTPPPSLADKAPETPKELVKLIEDMLIKTASERPTMDVIEQRLEAMLRSLDRSDPPLSLEPQPAPKPEPAPASSATWLPLFASAAVGFFLVSLLLLFFLLTRH